MKQAMVSPSATSSSLLLTTVKWAVENDMFLADFVHRLPLPHLALVTKGQYLSVGAPNVSNPTLKPYILVHSTRKVKKVLAQLLRVKEGKGRKLLTEHKVAIPETFNGYFEILSEDGRPVRCLESVLDLQQRNPELCLVRQPCKAYLPDGDGELRNLYKTRNVLEGEVLTVVGQFNFKRISFLRCFDELGSSIYMKLTQKGRFSPVARPDASPLSVSGVYPIQQLINKRMPLTVKLIQGRIPQPLLKTMGSGPLVLQLLGVFQEDVVLIHSLQKDDGESFVVPINAHVKMAPAKNHSAVRHRNEFHSLCDKCDNESDVLFDQINVVHDQQIVQDTNTAASRLSNKSNNTQIVNIDEEETSKKVDPAVCDEEIEQLYDYIRGLAPLPQSSVQKTTPKLKHSVSTKIIRNSKSPSSRGLGKPPPPPIETIPGRSSNDSLTSPERSRKSKDKDRSRSIGSVDRTTIHSGSGGTAVSSGLRPDKRLDDVIYGRKSSAGGSPARRMSKSTEKLYHMSPLSRFPFPFPSPPHPYSMHPSGTSSPGDNSSGGSKGGVSSAKRRPLSMVLPDNFPLFPMPPHPGPLPPPGAYPSSHYFAYGRHQHPPGMPPPGFPPFYHSFMNLSHSGENNEPPPAYSPPGRQGPSPPPQPPPGFVGFPSHRAVHPRFAPRYQYQQAIYKM